MVHLCGVRGHTQRASLPSITGSICVDLCHIIPDHNVMAGEEEHNVMAGGGGAQYNGRGRRRSTM